MTDHLPQIQPPLLEPLLALQDYLQQLYQERFDRLLLFGSYARGEASADSDVDVLIVLEDPVDPSETLRQTSHFVAQLCLDHNLLISPLFIGKSRFESENSPLLRNIRAEAVSL